MISKNTKLAILTALISVPVWLTIQTVSAEPAAAAMNIDQLSDFLGDGQCTGQIMAMGKTHGYATTGRFHAEKVLDGKWIAIHYDEEQTVANPKPFHIVQYLGYDSAKKQFVGMSFDNSGSSYGAASSPGWTGDSIVFNNAPAADGTMSRDTFTRNGSKELMHVTTIQDKNKQWAKTDEETCHKS